MDKQNLHSDAKSSIDLLNRKAFASGIARTLVQAMPEQNESLVFGLNGRWGSGKSTLLDFVVKEIRSKHESKTEERFEIFEFNPWMFSGQEQLLWSFYRALLRKIEGENSVIKKHAKSFSEWLETSKPGQFLGSLPFVDEYKEKISKSIMHLLGEGVLEDVKKKLDTALVENNVRLYIIMDDLDRLTPDEITQVFQLVKLNANFKNTVFLLAYDKDIVVNAIEQKFKDNGERYLSKIVQVDYTLPEVLEEDIERIFFERLESFFKANEIPYTAEAPSIKTYWSKHGLKNYFRTLRDVYRYLNSLAFRLPDIWLEVNVTHFLIVEAIRIFDFAGYQNLYYEGLDWVRRTSDFPVFKDDEWTRSKFPNPITSEVLNILRRGSQQHKKAFSQNLFSTDSFEKYFALRISSQQLPEKDFVGFINNPEQGVPRLVQIHKNNRLGDLFLRLTTPEWEIKTGADIIVILDQLILFFESLTKKDRKDNFELLVKFINYVTNNPSNPVQRKNAFYCIKKINQQNYPHITRFVILYKMWNKSTDFKENDEYDKQREIINIIKGYSKQWLEHVFKQIPEVDDDFASHMLFTYAKFEPADYEKFLLDKFKDIDKLIWLLQQYINDSLEWLPEIDTILPPSSRSYFKELILNFLGNGEMLISDNDRRICILFLARLSLEFES